MVRNLVLGIMLSAAVHASAVMVFGPAAGDEDPSQSDAELSLPVLPPLKLGIDSSTAASINWIGFETPTEHSAMKSTVEQAAVTPVVGMTQVASEDQPDPAQPSEPSPQPVAQVPPAPAPSPETPTAPSPETMPSITIPSTLMVQADLFDPAGSAPLVKVAPLFTADPAERVSPSPKATKPEASTKPDTPRPQAAPPTPPSEKPTETQPTEAAKPADPAGTPGIKDEREADASTVVMNHNVSSGKPIAGEGLNIVTVRPEWSVTVKAIARPRNPVVQIHFGHDGVVKMAEFIKLDDRPAGTGHVHVDGPLLDAIYRWTAKGKAVDDLKKDDTLVVEIRLLLNGS